jgi:hypothetical protein
LGRTHFIVNYGRPSFGPTFYLERSSGLLRERQGFNWLRMPK